MQVGNSSGKTIKMFWHCRECMSIKCTAASPMSPPKNFSMFRMIWASSDFPGTTGKHFLMALFLNLIPHLISARNNWRKWTRKATVWSTIGKSIGPVSFPTETIVATGAFRFELIVLEKFNSILTGWSRDWYSGLHLLINGTPSLQGVKRGGQGKYYKPFIATLDMARYVPIFFKMKKICV